MITAAMVNSLRWKTWWAWMMACKKALEEAWWDEWKALEVLKKKWINKAAEKSDRATWEWRVFIKKEWNKTALVKITCETDFVAKNENIASFAEDILNEALSNWADSAIQKWESEVKDMIWKIWENIKIEWTEVIEADTAWMYIHSNWKIWVIVTLQWWNEEVAKDLAMHVAAMSPKYLSPEDFSNEIINKEREIWLTELSWKPEGIIENILSWKEKKLREESALKTQMFVKDNTITCEQYTKNNWAEILKFVRISV